MVNGAAATASTGATGHTGSDGNESVVGSGTTPAKPGAADAAGRNDGIGGDAWDPNPDATGAPMRAVMNVGRPVGRASAASE